MFSHILKKLSSQPVKNTYLKANIPGKFFPGFPAKVSGCACGFILQLRGIVFLIFTWMQKICSAGIYRETEQPVLAEKVVEYQAPANTFVPYYQAAENVSLDKETCSEYQPSSRLVWNNVGPDNPTSSQSLALRDSGDRPSTLSFDDPEAPELVDGFSVDFRSAAFLYNSITKYSSLETEHLSPDVAAHITGDSWAMISEKQTGVREFIVLDSPEKISSIKETFELLSSNLNKSETVVFVCLLQERASQNEIVKFYCTENAQQLLNSCTKDTHFTIILSGCRQLCIFESNFSIGKISPLVSEAFEGFLLSQSPGVLGHESWKHLQSRSSVFKIPSFAAILSSESSCFSRNIDLGKIRDSSRQKVEGSLPKYSLANSESNTPSLESTSSDWCEIDLEEDISSKIDECGGHKIGLESSGCYPNSAESLTALEYFDEELMQISDEDATDHLYDTSSLWNKLNLGFDYENEWMVNESNDGKDIGVVRDLDESFPDLRGLSFITAIKANRDDKTRGEIIKERKCKVSFNENGTANENVQPMSVVCFNPDDEPHMISKVGGKKHASARGILKLPADIRSYILIEPKVFRQPLSDQDLKVLEAQLWEKLHECIKISQALEQKQNLWELKEALGQFYTSFDFVRLHFAEVATNQVLEYMHRLGELRKISETASHLMLAVGNQFSALLVVIRYSELSIKAVTAVETNARSIVKTVSKVENLLKELQKALDQMKHDFNSYVPAMSRMGKVSLSIGLELLVIYEGFCHNNVEDRIERTVIDNLTGYGEFSQEMFFLKKNKNVDFQYTFGDALTKLQVSHDMVNIAKETIDTRTKDILKNLKLVRLDLVLEI